MSRYVPIILTPAEARGLLTLAEEGAIGILEDPDAAHAYIGPPPSQKAAERAIHKLRANLHGRGAPCET